MNTHAKIYTKSFQPKPERKIFAPRNAPQRRGAWLFIFADATALILCCFVLLYSMTVPKIQKWDEFIDNSTLKTNINDEKRVQDNQKIYQEISYINTSNSRRGEYLNQVLKQNLNGNKYLKDFIVNREEGHIRITFPPALMDAFLNKKFGVKNRVIIRELAGILNKVDNDMKIHIYQQAGDILKANSQELKKEGNAIPLAIFIQHILRRDGFERFMPVTFLAFSPEYNASADIVNMISDNLYQQLYKTTKNTMELIIIP